MAARTTVDALPEAKEPEVKGTPKVEKILERHRQLETEKAPWNLTWEIIGKYVMTRKQHFVSEGMDGELLNSDLFDDVAPNANHTLSSSLIGALWPNGAKSFRLKPPEVLETDETQEIKDFYKLCSRRMAKLLDDPRSGFTLALEEYSTDQGAFGISGIAVFETENTQYPFECIAVDAKKSSIDEDRLGFVDTLYLRKKMQIRQVVDQYGLDNVSPMLKKKFNDGKGSEKIDILHAMEPRYEADPYGFGVTNYPVASIHIELGTKHILKESGFKETPFFIPRFWKAMGEKYGRSPAMNALPSILEANAIREATIIAIEKNLDPPLSVADDGSLGGGTVDTSAGALNVYSVDGRIGQMNRKPIEPLYTVGELQSSYTRLAELTELIKQHFFLDRLLDFNNKVRMTLGEADMRKEFRGESLGMIYSRQIAELYKPLLDRVFNIMLRAGHFGVMKDSDEERKLLEAGLTPIYIPEAIQNLIKSGMPAYSIEFISPAARIMRNEEMAGINSTLQLLIGVAPVVPTILDNIDEDLLCQRIVDLTGAPLELVRGTDAVKKIRKIRADQQEKMVQAQMMKMGTEMQRDNAQANQMNAKAQQQGQQVA